MTPLPTVLRQSQRLMLFTGAGISTGSGIPDYRGPQGVWKRRQPVYYEEFLRSGEARVEYWDYKLESWPSIRDAKPNEIHRAAVRLHEAGKLLAVVTQNIDGLHQLAGLPEERVIQLHGNNRRVECLACRAQYDPQPFFDQFAATRIPPRCDACGGLVKPATISFGQNLDPETLSAAEEVARECDAVVALGSTLSVYPAAGFPLLAARRGVPYVIVNQGQTEHDRLAEVAWRLEANVGEVFPAAVDEALREEGEKAPIRQ